MLCPLLAYLYGITHLRVCWLDVWFADINWSFLWWNFRRLLFMPMSCQCLKRWSELTMTSLDFHLIRDSYMTKLIKSKKELMHKNIINANQCSSRAYSCCKGNWLNALIRLQDWHKSSCIAVTLNVRVSEQFYQRTVINNH